MRVLVDTNILLRSAQPTHPLCSQASGAVAELIRQENSLFFSPQVIAEFWNVATRPAGVNGLGLSNDEVMREVNAIERLLTLLPDNPAIYVAWKEVGGAQTGISLARLALSSVTPLSPLANPNLAPTVVNFP